MAEGPEKFDVSSTRAPRSVGGWYVAGAVLLLLGTLTLIWPVRDPGSGITRQVDVTLERVDRVEAPRGALKDWNVLIITMDTTRADHIGCYGNRLIETPVIDQLAKDGLLFSQAITPVPATLPAHSSMLTGKNPYNHGARANGTFRLEDEKNLTLSEVLLEAGYRTGAAISAFVLDGQYGLNQGFETYDDDLRKGVKYSPQMFRERPAELTNEPVLRWLDEHGQERFFLWVHYFDPHAVYLPPEPFRTRYAGNLYDGEIAYLDSQIGRLLEHIDALGVRDRTLVILTADHGEGLGEHGEQTHSLLVYDSTLHIPMIFRAPGVIAPGRVAERQVSLVDVMPTVLALLGHDAPPGMDGHSLLEGPPAGPRTAYIETISTMTLHGWAPLMGVRRDDYKFILAPAPEIYDLRTDPRELQNLYEARPDLAEALKQDFFDFVGEDINLQTTPTQNMEIDPASAAKLHALGYIASVPEELGEVEVEELPDPKEAIFHWEQVQEGVSRKNTGDIAAAIEILEACLEEVPRDVWSMQILGSAYATYGDDDKALEVYRRAARLAPKELGVHLALAGVYLGQGRVDEAVESLAQAEAIDAESEAKSGDLKIVKARVAYFQRDEAGALELLQRAIELDPGSAGPRAYVEMGAIHFTARRLDEAREAFNEAIAIDGMNGHAHDGLARILIEEGNLTEAEEQLKIALRFNPAQPRALATAGGILSDREAYDDARVLLEHALQMTPVFAPALNNLALLYRRQGMWEEAEAKYLEAIEAAPRFDLAHANLAQLYLLQDKEEEAIASFRKAVQANPYNAIALVNLGIHHMRADRPGPALSLLAAAVRVNPDYAMGHKYLGLVFHRGGQAERATFHLERSLELDPHLPEAEKVRGLLQALRAPPPPDTSTSP